jgi:hypothetical protein
MSLADEDYLTGAQARSSISNLCSKGDVVLVKSADGSRIEAGEVLFHFSAKGEPGTMVNLWSLINFDPSHYLAEWSVVNARSQLIGTNEIVATVMWTKLRESVRTIVPVELHPYFS